MAETLREPLGQAEAGAEPAPETERPLRGDRPPKKRGRPKKPSASSKPPAQGAVLKAQSKKLEAKLAELLTFPAMPVAMISTDPLTTAYMLEHFTRSGPRTAAVLIEASETSPELRAIIEKVTTGGSLFAVVLAVTAYTAPPVMWVLGMREQAAKITQATTMDEQALADIMAEANARAEAQYDAARTAEANGAPGPDGAEASPGADPLGPE